MTNYHLELTNNAERNIRAAEVRVMPDGTLVLLNESGKLILVYASGAWTMAEVEHLDDQGE